MWPIFFKIAQTTSNFYSHIPCGMWQLPPKANPMIAAFLLTHPVWDVTSIITLLTHILVQFLLTHPVWDVTTVLAFWRINTGAFLLTHPVWDVTIFFPIINSWLMQFLLTHPVWDVTVSIHSFLWAFLISTHTSRVGCDMLTVVRYLLFLHFYSHIPCGMWQN